MCVVRVPHRLSSIRLSSHGPRERKLGVTLPPEVAKAVRRLIPNPIRRVLSSIEQKRVRALLMGGQACVLCGAAEFSRDTDLAILASPANLVANLGQPVPTLDVNQR